MVKFYTTLEIYIEKKDKDKLIRLCLTNGLTSEKSKSICVEELEKEANMVFGFENSGRYYISGKAPYESIIRILNDAEFIIGVTVDA